uniref:Uncharacterized protein n=1 Tax=Solanum lycopersicum TaxID=4081 RepID=K4AVR0_SOLLC
MVVGDAEIKNLLSGCPALVNIVFNRYLELSHDFKFSLVDVSSLVDAKRTLDGTFIKNLEDDYEQYSDEEEDICSDYHQDFNTLVQDYLQNLSRANKLTFGTLFTQLTVSDCKHYTMENPYINFTNPSEQITEFCTFLLSFVSFGSVIFPNQKSVEIVISSGMCVKQHLKWEYQEAFQTFKHFVKECSGLKKSVVVSKRRRCKICRIKCVCPDFIAIC